jgi:hypothetical protein
LVSVSRSLVNDMQFTRAILNDHNIADVGMEGENILSQTHP